MFDNDNDLDRLLNDGLPIQLPVDEKGFTGRECPNPDCLRYFKVKFGTGLKGEVPCNCPYCGYKAGHDQFFTIDQNKFLTSVAENLVTKILLKKFKKLETQGSNRIIRWTVSGKISPLYEFEEAELETEIVCENCTHEYAIYGIWAYCPDCATHNSFQMLNKNFDIIEKMLGIATASNMLPEVSQQIIEGALAEVVSKFDGFGREFCHINASKSTDAAKSEKVSFQNLIGARKNILALWAIDISSAVSSTDWDFACKCFQKRHLLSHKFGVVDHEYLSKTNDPDAILGRKISVRLDEVLSLINVLKLLAGYLIGNL